MALLEKRKKEKTRKNLESLAFNEWIEKTPDEEIKKRPPPGRLDFFGFVPKPMVQGYFIKNEIEKFLKELNEKVKLTDKNRTREDKCHPMDSTPLIS